MTLLENWKYKFKKESSIFGFIIFKLKEIENISDVIKYSLNNLDNYIY